MKNLLKILPLIPLCLACSNDIGEGPGGQKDKTIGFGAKMEQTRAVAGLSDIQANGFSVWGGFSANDHLFDGRKVTYAGGQWGYTNPEVWTFNTYNFYAVYPSTIQATYTAPKTFTITDYSISDNRETDLLVAKHEDHNYPTDGNFVGLNFAHVLTQLEFVGSSTEASSMAFLNSIVLYGEGLPAMATYNATSATWALGTGTSETAPFLSSDNEGNGWQLSMGGNTVLSELMVYPKSEDKKVKLVLTTFNGTIKETTVELPPLAWEAGRRYRYTFSVDPNMYITFSEPEVVEWQTASAGNIVVE